MHHSSDIALNQRFGPRSRKPWTLLGLLCVATVGLVFVAYSHSSRNGLDPHTPYEMKGPVPTLPPGTSLLYVSPAGDDNNPGTYARPFRSPAVAARHLDPGDSLIILRGTYPLADETDIIIPPSGTSGARTTIRGESASWPTLISRGNLPAAIDLSGKKHVEVKNLEITHDTRLSDEHTDFQNGVLVDEEPAKNIRLENLYIHHVNQFGLKLQDVSDLEVTDTLIEYAGAGAIGGPAGIAGGWRNVRVDNCSFNFSGHYYQGSNGSNRPYDTSAGITIKPSAGPIEIAHTRVTFNRGAGIDSRASKTYVHHTIVSNNSADGIKLSGNRSSIENTLIYGRGGLEFGPGPGSALVIAPQEQTSTSFDIVNVTIDDSAGLNYIMKVRSSHHDVPINLTIRNTIFSSRGPNAPLFFSENTRGVLDHNLFYAPASEHVLIHGNERYESSAISILGSANLYWNPFFVKPAAPGSIGDYHLLAGSQAINAGTDQDIPPTDLDGERRPRGSAVDIGAFEFTMPWCASTFIPC